MGLPGWSDLHLYPVRRAHRSAAMSVRISPRACDLCLSLVRTLMAARQPRAVQAERVRVWVVSEPNGHAVFEANDLDLTRSR